MKTLLGEDEHLFSLYYSVDVYGNWEHGSNILYKSRSDRELEQLTGKPIAEIEATVERCASVLLEARAARVRPGLDDKVITCWNALMIKGYADAFIAFHEDAFLSAALHCAEFTWKTMWQEDKLLRVYRNGKASINAFAEDYATLCEAFIRLYEACADETWLLRARKIMDVALVLFHDGPGELFYFRSKDDAPLIARKTDFTDDVIPSANSVFAKCLHALGLMFDEQPYSDLALEMVTVIRPRLENHPNGYSNWMQLIQWMHRGFTQLVITGAQADEIFAETGEHYLPGTIRVRLTRPSEIPLLSDKPAHEDTAIYVCRDRTCGLPQQSIQPALEQLID